MNGYTKLFGTLIGSSLWRNESKETKIVWITMLAMANKNGMVETSLPGLADFAKVSRPECEEALVHLESPDPDSRTPDHEGKRIHRVEGGWLILNHKKYRDKMNLDDRKMYLAQKQAEYRSKIKPPSPSPSTQPSKKDDPQVLEIYSAYPLKVAKPDALRAISKALKKVEFERLLSLTKLYASKRGIGAKFTPHPSRWFNAEMYNDDPSTWSDSAPSQFKNITPGGNL